MKGFTIIEVVIAVAILAILALIPIAGKMECDGQASRIGKQHEWTFFGGCMIEDKGRWIPLKNYRVLE
ncbi:MAG TPA: prepilin-type N-terminal cleavage/methylation domain-containing protein [Syntrophales bacterium]|nr:prepilin-type N-terminal cleavage/methylation domain-containing protein [Syntrophales bacterium]